MIALFILAMLTFHQFQGGLVKPVMAQTEAPTLEATASASPVALDTLAESEVTTMTNTYHGQLAEYRDAERAYQVNIGQYKQLQTLVSLEAAVQATHKAQTLRDQVLITYLSLLKFQMSQATGVNLDQKDHAVADLQAALSGLQSHLVASTQATTRDDVNQVAANFTPLEATVKTAAYEAQTLLAIGKLQTIYDKTGTLTDEIDTTLVQQNTDVKQPQRQRAITEIRKSLVDAKTTINSIIDQRVNGNNITFSQSTYESSREDLNQLYAQLSQTLGFLDELLRL